MTEPAAPLPARVRIDTLRMGAKFTSADGVHCTYERRDGANSGAYHVRRADETATMFAGCALVTLGWNDRGWFADRETYERIDRAARAEPAEPEESGRDPFDSFASDF